MAQLTTAIQPNRLFVVTGDPSGEAHAADVVRALHEIQPGIHVAGVGGHEMAEAGVHLLADHSQMARIGPGGFLAGIPYHLKLAAQIEQYLEAFQPGVVLLVDYGGFNLRLAKRLKSRGHRVAYFIPPQVWASRPGRMKFLQRYVDRVFCIFPFEMDLYERAGVPVTYVGHPLVSQLSVPEDRNAFCARHGLNADRRLIALLPGSRRMECDYLMGPMLASVPYLAARQQGAQFVISQAPNIKDEAFHAQLRDVLHHAGQVPVRVVKGDTPALLAHAWGAVVTSGTATLQAGLVQTPHVIVYKGHWLAYQLARRLIRVPCIGLPNLLCDPQNPPAPELWQADVNGQTIAASLTPLLTADSEARRYALRSFSTLRDVLAPPPSVGTSAAGVAAGLIKEMRYAAEAR